jgi:hypothetical protein
VPTVRIPRTCPDRKQLTWALLIARVFPRARNSFQIFEGTHLRPGSRVHEADLRPTPDHPETPLLIEYAGNDRTGRGHNRSNDIHVLWKYEINGWVELARVTSQGPEWVTHLMPMALKHMRGSIPNDAEIAGKATRRILEVLDRELEGLAADGRERAMSFLYDEFTARLLDAA